METEFFIYAGIFRLAVLATASYCFRLGYLLLISDKGQEARGKSPEFQAKIPGASIFLRNAATGVFLCLFGAVMVVVLLLGGLPQYIGPTETLRGPRNVTLKGAERGFDEILEEAKEAEDRENIDKAMACYASALNRLADPMNNLAYLRVQKGDTKGAEPLALLATQLDPKSAAYHDTLFEVFKSEGRTQEAIRALEIAAALNPHFVDKLKQEKER